MKIREYLIRLKATQEGYRLHRRTVLCNLGRFEVI